MTDTWRPAMPGETPGQMDPELHPEWYQQRTADQFQVFQDALLTEHLERIMYALEQLQRSYADIQSKLVRIEPMIEYAEQLVNTQKKISKWLPRNKT